MKRYYKAPVKLTAVVLSLMLVISAFSGLFGAFTSYAVNEGDFTIYNTTSNVAGEMLLSGNPTAKFVKNGTSTSLDSSLSSGIGKICDGNSSNELEIPVAYAPFFDLKSGATSSSREYSDIEKFYTDGTERYLEIVLPIKGGAIISDIVVVNNNGEQLMTGRYVIYAGENKTHLFDDENIIKDYDNTQLKKQTQDFHFNSGKELTGVKYVGMRMYNPITDTSESGIGAHLRLHNLSYWNIAGLIKPRIREFNVYGTIDSSYVPEEPPANLINMSTATPKLEFNANGKTTKVTATRANALTDGVLDGGTDKQCEIYGAKFATWDSSAGKAIYYTENENYYLDMIYDFKTEVDLNYIVVGNHNNGALASGEYEVFIGNSKKTLFDGEPYITVNNVDDWLDGTLNRVNIIAFDKADTSVVSKARYVAIRLQSPVCETGSGVVEVTANKNNIYPRLFELSIYGETPSFELPVGRTLTDTQGFPLETLVDNGPSVIHGSDTKVKSGNSSIRDTKILTPIQQIVDSDYSAEHKDVSGLAPYEEPVIYWPLKDPDGDVCDAVQIDGFVFQGISQDNKEPYYTSHYQISVAEEAEDLFTDDTIVFEYNADDGDDEIMKGCIYYFPEGEKPVGNYVGIKILNPVYSATQWAYTRFSIIKFWGDGVIIPGVPSNLAENMPITANYINGDKRTAISETNLTVTEVRNLTDSNASNYANITTNKSSRKTVEMTYNLCGDMKIDGFWASTVISSDTGFEKMKVYASSSLSGVNDESSLVWTYSVGSKTGTLKPTKDFSTQIKARYVRFVFEGTKDYLKIGELYVNGLYNQKNKTKVLNNVMTASDVSVTKTKIKTGSTSEITLKTSLAEYIIDKDPETYTCLFDNTVVGEDFYSITLNLQELRTVSKLVLRLQKHFEKYWAGTINVYLVESPVDVDSTDTEPDYVIKKSDIGKDGELEKYIRPKLARYVKIELKDFDKNPEFLNAEGQYMITTLINDIIVTGTNVKGMQTGESEELVTFDSAKNNAAVSILKLDTNDVFDSVVSLKMTPEKATNWQMRSLEKIPYMKVLDKTVYKVELLDLYGNRVEDFKGRDIKVMFKIPDGYEALDISIGSATDRTKIEVFETTNDGTYAYATFTYTAGVDNKIAFLATTTSYDEYWGTIGELEDFSEGNPDDLNNDDNGEEEEEKDPEYYRWIHTDDNRFQVAGVTNELEEGATFTAEDISSSVSDSEYETVLELAEGKKVAVFYDMKLTTKSGNDYDLAGDFVDVKLNLPDFIYDNFTDLQILHIDSDGMATLLWSEVADREFAFQTGTFSHFAIIGTALDGSSSIGDGSEGEVPTTGETAGALFASILAMAAAAFVAIRFGKRVKR